MYEYKEICKEISDTAIYEYDIKKNSSYYVEAICLYITYKRTSSSLKTIHTYPHAEMFYKVDSLILNGTISRNEGQELQSKLMMWQSEQYKLNALFDDWFDQSEHILCKKMLLSSVVFIKR